MEVGASGCWSRSSASEVSTLHSMNKKSLQKKPYGADGVAFAARAGMMGEAERSLTAGSFPRTEAAPSR